MIYFIDTIIRAITVPVRQLYYWFCQCLPSINLLKNMSLPWKWTLVSIFFLLSVWIGAGVNLWLFTENKTDRNWFLWIVIGSPALIVIPFLVYHFVRYWMMEEVSKYPDIDRIWNEGLELAEQNGIRIDETPMFLVLGTAGVRESNNFIQISELNMVAKSPTTGDGPISFYANQDCIFLFVHGCSCVSRLTIAPVRSNRVSVNDLSESGDAGGTIDVGYLNEVRSNSPVSPPEIASGTLFSNQDPDIDPGRAADISSVQGGTMLLEEGQDIASWIDQPTGQSKQLSSQEIEDCAGRLLHLCKRVREARAPVCPMNGVLAALPFELIESSAGPLQLAIQRDLSILRNTLQVRVPNTVLITGLELDEGFVELMKRLPRQQIIDNRFGKGADLWYSPDAARLSAISVHATSQFEDWIYMLFQSDGALKRKHNSRLFGLLCRVRGGFSDNLKNVLAGGFGFNPQTDPHLASEQFLFGGCYFAATGNGSSEQGFVKNVIRKLLEQQGELEWTPAALQQDNRYQSLANIAALIGLLAILAICAMVIYKFGYQFV